MLKEILDYGKGLVFLVQETKQNTADIKDLRQELERLTRTVDRLAVEVQHRHELMARDQRETLLRLEPALERFERRLPSPPKASGENMA